MNFLFLDTLEIISKNFNVPLNFLECIQNDCESKKTATQSKENANTVIINFSMYYELIKIPKRNKKRSTKITNFYINLCTILHLIINRGISKLRKIFEYIATIVAIISAILTIWSFIKDDPKKHKEDLNNTIIINNVITNNQTQNSDNKHSLDLLQNSQIAIEKNIKILSVYHPSKEPTGLYIVNFYNKITNDKRVYRIYCPNQTVRDITYKKWDKARSIFKEDQIKYNNNRIIRQVFDYTCKK